MRCKDLFLLAHKPLSLAIYTDLCSQGKIDLAIFFEVAAIRC